jgi:pimeloyl-ACP methyl ester carboxylesterase
MEPPLARYKSIISSRRGHRCALPSALVRASLRTMTLRLAAIAVALLTAFPVGAGGTPRGLGSRPAIDRVVALTGGRQIALHCIGAGTFTVLLETGDGGRRSHMAKLSAALAQRYRVCDYDRRNVGRSSAAPLPRKAAALAADLFDVLAAAGVRGPYILFGSSIGGLLVRSYAATHAVAGLVTSNQPGTSREWAREAFAVMTPAQRAADRAWMAGENIEHIDVNDVSRTIDDSAAPTVPHIIMISTERFQCLAAGSCGPLYSAFVAASRRAATVGSHGCFRVIDGSHDLYVTHLREVVTAIDGVAASAAIRR